MPDSGSAKRLLKDGKHPSLSRDLRSARKEKANKRMDHFEIWIFLELSFKFEITS